MRCRKIWDVIQKVSEETALRVQPYSKLKEKSAQIQSEQRAPGRRALETKEINNNNFKIIITMIIINSY